MRTAGYAWALPVAAVMLAAGILIGRCAGDWLLLAAAGLCSLLACLLLKRRGRFAAAQAVVLALGSLLGYAAYHPMLPAEETYTVTGVVAEEIRLRDDGQVSTLLHAVRLNGKWQGSGAYWSFYLDEGEALPEGLAPGKAVKLTARLYHPGGADNPGGYNFKEYLLQRGVTIGLYGRDDLVVADTWHPLGLAAAIRHELTSRLKQVMGDAAGGYASTMLLGSRHLIPSEERNAFSRLGIAHILSVSGFHVSVLAGIVTWLLRKFHLSRRLRFVCTSAVLAAYSLLAGLSVPMIRAALLYLLYEFGALKHRQRSSLHLLSASWIVQLVLSPVQLTSASFHLTYGAMLGLVLVAPWLGGQWSPPRLGKAWRVLCVSLGAQIGILLPTLYWFHELPVLGVLLNTVALGMVTLLMQCCWVLLLLLPLEPVAMLLGRLTGLALGGMLSGVKHLSSLEWVTLWTCQANLLTAAGCAVLMLALSWWWPGKRRLAAIGLSLALVCLSVMPWPHSGTEYIQFSVGDADAALLRDGDLDVAIDAGENGKTLADK